LLRSNPPPATVAFNGKTTKMPVTMEGHYDQDAICSAGDICRGYVGVSNAAEIRVLSSQNMRGILSKLAPPFEKETSQKLVLNYDAAVPVKNGVLAGEPVDVAITQRALIEELSTQQRIIGPIVDIAHTAFAVIVRVGIPRPNISTVDAFRQAVLSAASIAHADPARGSPAGLYFPTIFERLGIAEQVKQRTRLVPGGSNGVRQLVAAGDVAMGFASIGDFTPPRGSAEGVQVVGLLPDGLPKLFVSGAIVTGTREQVGAAAFLKVLASPEAIPALRAEGFEPH
jgi:molybdate transport system substrate-binding protein